jgi:perosamine synthetase
MIPIYKPYFSEKNLKYAHDAINSGWVSSQGEFLDLAKNELKKLLGSKWVILTSNGTTATHLLSIALKYKYPHIKKIVVPNNVYVAAWNSFLFNKDYELIPVDADLETWNFDISKLESVIDETTAVLVVHNIGNVINVPDLRKKFPNTIFLEDNCEGFSGKYDGKFTGTDCFASSVSFFGNKTITSGEGGAFITTDDDVFEFINKVKSQGQSNLKFIHDELGYNYRMTNVEAAILCGQLDSFREIKEKKHNVFNRYKTNLKGLDEITFQKIEHNTEHSEWMFGIRLQNFTLEQKQNLELHLFQSNIESRPMFYQMKKHAHLRHIENEDKNATLLNHQCLILPSYPQLTDSQIDFISENIINYIKNL